MKTLIFGPSGAGKTYYAEKLNTLGINSIDADSISGLSSWFDGQGKKVPYPENADQDFFENHSFLWDKAFLKKFLSQQQDLYIFGVSGNIFDMLDLFDKTYYLHIPDELQNERLQHSSRKNPMGKTEYQRKNAIKWGHQLQEQAKKLEIEFIDTSKSLEEMVALLSSMD